MPKRSIPDLLNLFFTQRHICPALLPSHSLIQNVQRTVSVKYLSNIPFFLSPAKVFYSVIWGVTCHHVCWKLLFLETNLSIMWEALHRMQVSAGGTLWGLGSTVHLRTKVAGYSWAFSLHLFNYRCLFCFLNYFFQVINLLQTVKGFIFLIIIIHWLQEFLILSL